MKALAVAVPAHTIFTNEQLAPIVQGRASTTAAPKKIAGIGDARGVEARSWFRVRGLQFTCPAPPAVVLLGVRCGPGLIVASLLFALIHALNTFDYLGGRYDFAWRWMIANFFVGLFLGMMREGAGSVLPGAIVHGLDDVVGRVPGMLP